MNSSNRNIMRVHTAHWSKWNFEFERVSGKHLAASIRDRWWCCLQFANIYKKKTVSKIRYIFVSIENIFVSNVLKFSYVVKTLLNRIIFFFLSIDRWVLCSRSAAQRFRSNLERYGIFSTNFFPRLVPKD